MPELFVKDIFHEYVSEIETDLKKIKEISGGAMWMESSFSVGTLKRVSKKIYAKYGSRIVAPENATYAEDIIYSQLVVCTRELSKKYFGWSA
jgi:hypothetical protein